MIFRAKNILSNFYCVAIIIDDHIDIFCKPRLGICVIPKEIYHIFVGPQLGRLNCGVPDLNAIRLHRTTYKIDPPFLDPGTRETPQAAQE